MSGILWLRPAARPGLAARRESVDQAGWRLVTRATESLSPNRIGHGPLSTLLSLGSQQGNAHLHWHIQPLTPGTPYHRQQYHALMAENGVIPWTGEQAADLGVRLRAALAAE